MTWWNRMHRWENLIYGTLPSDDVEVFVGGDFWRAGDTFIAQNVDNTLSYTVKIKEIQCARTSQSALPARKPGSASKSRSA